jgi:hypothetical protein
VGRSLRFDRSNLNGFCVVSAQRIFKCSADCRFIKLAFAWNLVSLSWPRKVKVPIGVREVEHHANICCGHLVLDLPVDSNGSIGSDPNLIGRCANPQKVSVRRNHAHNRPIFGEVPGDRPVTGATAKQQRHQTYQN